MKPRGPPLPPARAVGARPRGLLLSAGRGLGQPRPLSAEWEENLLHIGQEVLTNALRHAHATQFHAGLVFGPDELRLELRDNGRGFDPGIKHDGFGLTGIKERIESMGGRVTIQSAIDRGTAILIILPLVNSR